MKNHAVAEHRPVLLRYQLHQIVFDLYGVVIFGQAHASAEALKLPLCNTHWGRGAWPFFQPLIVPHGPEKWHYLGEDWSFSYRLARIGVTPVADTSIRLWHWGRYGFGWEDAGRTAEPFRSYTYRLAAT